MNLKKLLASTTAATVLAIGGIAATSGEAHAVTWSPMSFKLCQARCTIDAAIATIPKVANEGSVIPVTVRGAANASISIRAFMYDGKTLTPVSGALAVKLPATPASGSYKNVSLRLTKLVAPKVSNYPIIVQPADITPAQLAAGYYVPHGGTTEDISKFDLHSERAMDAGWSGTMSAAGVATRVVRNGIAGQEFGVQLLVGKTWRNITKTYGKVNTGGYARIEIQSPKDLPKGKYYTRVFNKSRGIYDLTPANAYWIEITEPNVYTDPGRHSKNGREWNTTCEKYSSTVTRCRTDIYATKLTYANGRYHSENGWVFNNLTYLPSPRKNWVGNPLAANGKVGGKVAWTATDGRKWRTECDTALTGKGGCRSFVMSQVVVATKTSSGYRYSLANQWVFNNMVMFS